MKAVARHRLAVGCALALTLGCGACAGVKERYFNADTRGAWTLGVGPYPLDGEGWDAYEGRVQVLVGGLVPPLEAFVGYAQMKPVQPDDPLGEVADTRTVDVVDMRVGFAHAWRPFARVELVAGVGPRLAFASTTRPGMFNEISERAVSVGVYAHGGAYARIIEGWWFGVDAHAALGTGFDLADRDRADEVYAALLVLRWDW